MPRCLQVHGRGPYSGLCYLLERWVSYLIERGWTVDVVANHPDVCARLEAAGASLVDIDISRTIEPATDLMAIARLVRHLTDGDYELTHTYTSTAGFVGRLAGRLARTPVVLHHQAGWPVIATSSIKQKLLFTPFEALAVFASTASICVSEAIRDAGPKLHIGAPWKLVTIANGIDPEPLLQDPSEAGRKELRAHFGIPDGVVAIGNASRLATQKDLYSTIFAMKHLAELPGGERARLYIAGEGILETRLRHFIAEHRLEDRVELIGFVDDVPGFLHALDIYSYPSLWEGLSISLLEAMAAGLPIVTSDIAPNTELIDDGVHGLVVPTRAPKALAQALHRFIADPRAASEMGAKARRRCVEDYHIDRCFAETFELYERLIEARQG